MYCDTRYILIVRNTCHYDDRDIDDHDIDTGKHPNSYYNNIYHCYCTTMQYITSAALGKYMGGCNLAECKFGCLAGFNLVEV